MDKKLLRLLHNGDRRAYIVLKQMCQTSASLSSPAGLLEFWNSTPTGTFGPTDKLMTAEVPIREHITAGALTPDLSSNTRSHVYLILKDRQQTRLY